MAIHNTSYDAANTAVRAFLTKVGAKYWGSSFNTASGSGKQIWQKIKDDIFARKCCYCGGSSTKLQIEHLLMFNREEYGLHHPGNVAPVCDRCNKRSKDKNGKNLSWEVHLKEVCIRANEVQYYESRRTRILNHIEKGEFAYPKLTQNEKHAIRVIAESLYQNITAETENSLKLYDKITEAFVGNQKNR
ncbi:MAG: HNH endonuclease [Candidatus Lokiarchaeia archaeon]